MPTQLKTNYLLAGLVVVASVFTFCIKPPDYPDEPVIEYKRLSRNLLLQKSLVSNPNNETTVITIGFTDGDGDLGFNDTTSTVTVIDPRLNVPIPAVYTLPEIDHLGAGNGISGDIMLTIPTTCCIPPPTDEGILLPPCDTMTIFRDTVSFRIQLRDRAGHFSNVVETEPIVLICRR